MSLFVDTSGWSLALRRDRPPATPEVGELARAVGAGEPVYTTGLVLQELLQGVSGPKMRTAIVERFLALPMLNPTRHDHTEAAELKNHCRRNGIQIDTIDALLAQVCIHRDLVMLTADRDFRQIARRSSLKVWTS